jgi:hypothetical protein
MTNDAGKPQKHTAARKEESFAASFFKTLPAWMICSQVSQQDFSQRYTHPMYVTDASKPVYLP